MTRILQTLSLVAILVSAAWASIPAVYHVLIVVIILDVLSGTIHAIKDKKLSSEVAYTGILKKGGELILVGAASYVQREIPGLSDVPLGQALAGFYCYVEALSLLENSAALGVPIPQWLRDALVKLAPDKQIPSGNGEPAG